MLVFWVSTCAFQEFVYFLLHRRIHLDQPRAGPSETFAGIFFVASRPRLLWLPIPLVAWSSTSDGPLVSPCGQPPCFRVASRCWRRAGKTLRWCDADEYKLWRTPSAGSARFTISVKFILMGRKEFHGRASGPWGRRTGLRRAAARSGQRSLMTKSELARTSKSLGKGGVATQASRVSGRKSPVPACSRFSVVTRAISVSASRVRNAWWVVMSTLGNVSRRESSSSCSTSPE